MGSVFSRWDLPRAAKPAMIALMTLVLAAAPVGARAQPAPFTPQNPVSSNGHFYAFYGREEAAKLSGLVNALDQSLQDCDANAYNAAVAALKAEETALVAAISAFDKENNAPNFPNATAQEAHRRMTQDLYQVQSLLQGLPRYSDHCPRLAAAPSPPAPPPPPPLVAPPPPPPLEQPPPQEQPQPPLPPSEPPKIEPKDGDGDVEPDPEPIPEPPSTIVNGKLSVRAQALAKCATAGEEERIRQLLSSINTDQSKIAELAAAPKAAEQAWINQQLLMRNSAAAYVGHPELYRVDDNILLQLQQKAAEALEAATAAEAPYKKEIEDATSEIEAILKGISDRGCPPPGAAANGEGHASAPSPAGPSLLRSVLGGAVSIGIGAGEERLAAPNSRGRDEAAPAAHVAPAPPTHDTPPPAE